MTSPPEVPEYNLKEKIGQGAIATVYRATHSESGRNVAVKILKPALNQNEVLVKRLIMEARAAGRIQHPNIVSVYHAGRTTSIFFIVMEFLSGSLKEQIADSGPTKDAKKSLFLIQRLVDALIHAHSMDIVHRDVKPANIMFRAEGTPVLVDFGLAKLTHSLESVTKSGITVGTPDYMSPEQIQGHGVDGRSDVYSLGVVLYELLTGRVPYKAQNYVSLAVKHITKKIPRLPRRLRRVQPLLDGMMAKNIDKRFPTGKPLIELIEQTMAGV